MEGTTLPRVPGRDFAGVVVDGPREWLGAQVWGTGGDVGFTRHGSHAEYLAVPVAALARKPERLSFEEASAVGVNFVVGWLGAVEIARLRRDESVVIFGVSGGVGGAVAQIAHSFGARVYGLDLVPPAPDTPAARIVERFAAFTGDTDEAVARVREWTGGHGADLVYDAVGGVTTPAALGSLALRGRLVMISSVGTRTVQIDVPDFYHRELRMFGADSRKLDVVESGRRLTRLTPYFERGDFRPLPITRRFSLADGCKAYTAVAESVPGRVVITPEP
jgi:NADPH:quinone reductase-like Zn-dependent oxidoreductase